MDKLKFRRSGIQARVLALTMFFTLGASLAFVTMIPPVFPAFAALPLH